MSSSSVEIKRAVKLTLVKNGRIVSVNGKQEKVVVEPGIYNFSEMENPIAPGLCRWSVVTLSDGTQAGLAEEPFAKAVELIVPRSRPVFIQPA